jgi:hypothetical protein
MQQVKVSREKSYYNCYCDAIRTALNCFLPVEESERLLEEDLFSKEELLTLSKFALVLNSRADVGKVNLSAPNADILPFFEEFGLDGRVILPYEAIPSLKTSDFVGGRVALEVKSLLENDEKTISDISDLSGKMKIPVFINFGRTLEEVGLLSSRYNSSPARLLEDFGFLDRECYLLGCNFIDKDDLDIISSYGGKVVLTPRSDMMKGCGAVNLYSIENKGIEYGFGNQSYPQIDMANEAEIARGNTANLLYERGLISTESLLKALLLEEEDSERSIEKDKVFPLENVFKINDNCTKKEDEKFDLLKTQTEKIIKEKIWKS